MQDMIPGLAPDPNMVLPFASLGITERLRRPILDHMLLGTLQACAIQICEYFCDNGSSSCMHLMDTTAEFEF